MGFPVFTSARASANIERDRAEFNLADPRDQIRLESAKASFPINSKWMEVSTIEFQ
jgi:hypothetical protein